MIDSKASIVLGDTTLALDKLLHLAHQGVMQVQDNTSSIGRCRPNRTGLKGASGHLTFFGDKTHLLKGAHGYGGIVPEKNNSSLEGDLLLDHDLCDENRKRYAPVAWSTKVALINV